MDETEGFQYLEHQNCTICIPLNPSCLWNFPTFSLSYWEANSYYPRGPIIRKENSSNLKSGWDRGFSVPGAFKLDHLHPFKPLLFWKFSKFFTFILGGQFLLPQRANNGKRGILQLQKRMTQWVSCAWDHWAEQKCLKIAPGTHLFLHFVVVIVVDLFGSSPLLSRG